MAKERAQKAESLQDKHKYGHADANAVLDAQGKLMPKGHFHGAFTGGFSAGYFNSVGSAEGWAPSTFSSSPLMSAQVPITPWGSPWEQGSLWPSSVRLEPLH